MFIYIQKLTSALPKTQKAIVEDHNLYWLLKKFVLILNSGYNSLLPYISFSQTLLKKPLFHEMFIETLVEVGMRGVGVGMGGMERKKEMIL